MQYLQIISVLQRDSVTSLPIRLLVILQKFSSAVFTSVAAGDDQVHDAHRTG